MHPELFQFHFSHFNEKARWALDYKKVAHVRRSLLPGPHGLRMVRMTGKTQVPALRSDGEVIAGSSQIIDYLERTHPEPPLYPADEEERRKALEIQRWFDDEVGPQIRQALFYELLPAGNYLAQLATQGCGPLAAALYRASFPAVRLLMKLDMKIDAESAARGRERTREALDFVVKQAGPHGYLVGDAFSVADLTAASLLLVTRFPPELQFLLPEPRVPAVEQWLSSWRDHPGVAWVAEMYRRHRGHSAAVAG